MATSHVRDRTRQIVRVLAAAAMVAVGVTHFTSPDGFEKIVPSFLPAPRFLVLLSGFFEIAGGLGRSPMRRPPARDMLKPRA